ncbi:hypothetical protein RND71_043977 [Anisodus tanguticus]|uniref:tRNA (adenine(58)-N(1))-methyltransferase n=1 Tax=Anisodus tanguticus TaxID=243964 RepID=A0AAE1QNJ6_9SOLA|nr:hypothetical protein RND71_043977 [Anisodus tanguticus]
MGGRNLPVMDKSSDTSDAFVEVSSSKNVRVKKLNDIQRIISDLVVRNKERYGLSHINNSVIQNSNSPTNQNLATNNDLEDLVSNESSDDEKFTFRNKNLTTKQLAEQCVILEVDDSDDADIISLMIDSEVPKSFEIINTDYQMPGNEPFLSIYQSFSKVFRAKITSTKQFSTQFDWMIQSLLVKLRRLTPCALAGLKFKVDAPEADMIQITILGTVHSRVRTSTISEGTSLDKNALPTVFKWEGGGKNVYIKGTFSNWKPIKMSHSHGDFVAIVNIPEVIEAGTGSGSLSHSIIRTVFPTGHLYTFDFHEERVKLANEEFKEHKLDPYVTCKQKDVCKDGFDLENCVDAVFLDLPRPWEAIPFAYDALKNKDMTCLSYVSSLIKNFIMNEFMDYLTFDFLSQNFQLCDNSILYSKLFQGLQNSTFPFLKNKCKKEVKDFISFFVV